jgi:hypothetical protein
VSGNIVNLRTFRKRKERAEREAEATANRALHGRTKGERRLEDTRRDAADRAHDGRRLDPGDDGPSTDR